MYILVMNLVCTKDMRLAGGVSSVPIKITEKLCECSATLDHATTSR